MVTWSRGFWVCRRSSDLTSAQMSGCLVMSLNYQVEKWRKKSPKTRTKTYFFQLIYLSWNLKSCFDILISKLIIHFLDGVLLWKQGSRIIYAGDIKVLDVQKTRITVKTNFILCNFYVDNSNTYILKVLSASRCEGMTDLH